MNLSQSALEALYARGAPGVRRHEWTPVKKDVRPASRQKTERIREYVRRHPWCRSARVAAFLRVRSNTVTNTLKDLTERGEILRRGRVKQYEYRVA